MVVKAEDGGAGGCVIAAYAFEHAGSVAYDVGQDMNSSLLPGDETSVVPDSLGGRQHGLIITLDAQPQMRVGERKLSAYKSVRNFSSILFLLCFRRLVLALFGYVRDALPHTAPSAFHVFY